MNAVIYARYSSLAQTEQSIEGQLRVCYEFAEKQGYKVIGEYIDRAKTGTNAERPDFQRMIEDSKKKLFQFVIVYKLDRFSRNKYDNAIYKQMLERNGVKVISATEIISNTPEGMLMEGLLEMFAELYSKDLSQKVKRGMRENVLKGLTIGGKVLYGYKVENKKIIINEEEEPVVRLIFEEYAKGTSKKEIVDILNERGYRTRDGQKFKISNLQDKLSNRKYTGYYKNDYIESEDYFPKIIDKELFNKVQERLKHNKRFSGKSNINFLLSGKVFCGHCGANMIGTSGTSHTGQTYAYYTCIEKNKRHGCKKSNESKDKLEDDVIKVLKQKILNQANLDEIAERIVQSYKKDLTTSAIEEYKRKIKSIDKEIDNLTDKFIKTNNDKILKEIERRIDDLSDQRENFKEQISKLTLALAVKHTKDDIKDHIRAFINEDVEQKDFEENRERIINGLVKCVYVFDDNIHVYINFDDVEEITLETAKEIEKEANKEFEQKMDCSTKTKIHHKLWCIFVFKHNILWLNKF